MFDQTLVVRKLRSIVEAIILLHTISMMLKGWQSHFNLIAELAVDHIGAVSSCSSVYCAIQKETVS